MKNQYFGDIGDYKKFNLLRTLSKNKSFKTCVCWLKTSDDGGNDGKHIHYLKKPSHWRNYDHEIYDLLKEAVLEKEERDLKIIEKSSLLADTTFYSEILTDDIEERSTYFKNLWNSTVDRDLIFFDPDNGIEIKSVKYGNKRSEKYLYWNEMETAYKKGYGLLIYQHFPRKKRDAYIRDLSLKIMDRLNTNSVFGIRTRHAAFFLIPRPEQIPKAMLCMQDYSKIWNEHVTISIHDKEKYHYIKTLNDLYNDLF